MKSFLLPLITLCALPIFAGTAPAAEPPYHLTTVSWVIDSKDNLDVDDRYVTLIGKVTKQIDADSYWFTDGTGTVRLDCAKPLPLNAKIVVGGRIDQAYLGIGHLEVDVKQWKYAKAP